jgi:hypothetical protein
MFLPTECLLQISHVMTQWYLFPFLHCSLPLPALVSFQLPYASRFPLDSAFSDF